VVYAAVAPRCSWPFGFLPPFRSPSYFTPALSPNRANTGNLRQHTKISLHPRRNSLCLWHVRCQHQGWNSGVFIKKVRRTLENLVTHERRLRHWACLRRFPAVIARRTFPSSGKPKRGSIPRCFRRRVEGAPCVPAATEHPTDFQESKGRPL